MTTRKYIVSDVKHCSPNEGRELGVGGFGTVVECDNSEGQFVMKRSKPYILNGSKHIDEMIGEYEYINYSAPKGVDKYAVVAHMYPVMKEDNSCFDKYALVMERMDGDLYKAYNDFAVSDKQTSKWLNKDWIYEIVQKLITMLAYFHDTVMYCHNDIKPSNIGYTTDSKVKLLDLGSSVEIAHNEKPYSIEDNKRLREGTLLYMTSGAFNGIQDSKNRDRWAMGCTIYELVAGTPMNHPMNTVTEYSYFNILTNYNKALLDYMLGATESKAGVKFISTGMEKARNKFVTNLSNFTDDRKQYITGYIYKYMTPSLVDTTLKMAGPLRREAWIGGGTPFVCNDPTQEHGVITGRGADGRLEIIRVTNIDKYKNYLESVKQGCGSVDGGGNNKPTSRKKITEKQYEMAKKSGRGRVAKYRLKDDGYVYYKYSK